MKKKEQSDTGRRRSSGEPAPAGAYPSGSITGEGCRRSFLWPAYDSTLWGGRTVPYAGSAAENESLLWLRVFRPVSGGVGMKETGDVRIRGEADGKTPIIVRPAVSVWLVVLLKLLRFFSDYRKALLVQELMVFPGGSGYYLCPRCRITLEREFVSYCDRCGQHLGWKRYRKARVIYPNRE